MDEKGRNRQVLDGLHVSALEEMLSGMQYGSITLIVQDGKIVQIDKTEKRRIKD